MSNTIRWASNKAKVADRAFSIAKVEAGAISLMPDPATGKFTEIELVPPPVVPAPPPPEPFELEIDMTGYPESTGKTLIPISTGHLMYDFTATGFGTINMFNSPGPAELNQPPFAISVTPEGVVLVSQANGTEGANPTNVQTVTVLTITSYRTYTTVNGVTVPSNPKTGVHIKVKGQTVTTDVIAPTISAMSPSGSSVAIGSAFTFTMSEPVAKGTSGTIKIWNETTNALIETLDVATAPSSGPGSIAIGTGQVIVTPTSALPYGVDVSIEFSAGVIKDLAGNGIAAVARGVWQVTTVIATTPITTFTPDLVVSSLSAILSTLAAWAADPVTTAPAGKAPLDDRVLGYNAILPGLTINNIHMPMNVYLRPVGVYGSTLAFGKSNPTCSTYINGVTTLNGCTNISLWRNDIRAPNTGLFNGAILVIKNCTNCHSIKNVARGWAFDLVQGNLGTTQRGIRIDGGTNCSVQYSATLYICDSSVDAYGTVNSPIFRGLMGRHSGGNFQKLATGSVISDLLREFCFTDRVFHPYKKLHGDDFQFNDGAISHRQNFRYNVNFRGYWTASYDPDADGYSSNATQTLYQSKGGSTSTGPHSFNQNLVCSGQQRGVDKIPGGSILTTNNNSMIDSILPNAPWPNGQAGRAPWPRIVATDISNDNFITAPNSAYVVNEGTGGLKLICSSDHHEILAYHEAVPTHLNDLWDIRPKAGTVTDPFYATPSARIGSYDLWSKLLLGDSQAVLSKQGWPTRQIFIEDFDRGDNFSGLHDTSMNFDANGDSV